MRHRLALILPVYLLACGLAYMAAFWIRFEFDPSAERLELLWDTLPFVLGAKLAIAALFGEFQRSFRYVTLSDLIYLGGTASTGMVLLGIWNSSLPLDLFIPRSVVVLDGMLTLLALAGVRSSYFMLGRMHLPWKSRTRERALIWDVQEESVAILRMLTSEAFQKSPYQIVGFVRADGEAVHSRIGGLPVYPEQRGWDDILGQSGAQHLLIPGGVPGRVSRDLFRKCSAVGMQVHVIPAVNEIINGRYKLSIRDLEVSDLLRREPNRLDLDSIRHYVTGKRVLVTGGAGSIGSELCRQLLDWEPATLVLYDQSEFGVFTMEGEFRRVPRQATDLHFIVADVLDERLLEQAMAEHQPEIVFHAAAYKHVPLMEDNPQSAVLNNILGTKAVADAAARHQVERFVLISTDKAVRPTSVMGASKLLAEKYVQSLSAHAKTRFITVRFGNVLNSMGSVVPTFRQQIEAGGPITVTHPDMVRFFMTIPEAVQLVLQAGAIGNSGDVLILDMGEPVRIVDLARDMIMLSGLKYPDDIDITFTGLRPGEKLYEELFYAGEAEPRRIHEKIFCGDNELRVPMPKLLAQISLLEESLTQGRSATLAALRDIVATYSDREWVPARLRAAA
jgi:FlaA1/EpsC-like NDP-sugar epimerase